MGLQDFISALSTSEVKAPPDARNDRQQTEPRWTRDSIRALLSSTSLGSQALQELMLAGMLDASVRQVIEEVGRELGVGDARTPLGPIDEYYVEKCEKLTLRWPLPENPFQPELPFDELDRRTQFFVLFNAWGRRELDGVMAFDAGDLLLSDQIMQECVLRAEQLEVPELIARSFEGRMKVADMAGDQDQARAWSRKAQQARGTGTALSGDNVEFIRREASYELHAGRFPEAEELLSGMIARLAEAQPPLPPLLLAECLQDRAQLRRLANRPAEALADITQACTIAEELPLLLERTVLVPGLWLQALLRVNPLYADQTYDLNAGSLLADRLDQIMGEGWEWVGDGVRQEIAHRARDWHGSIRYGVPLLAAMEKKASVFGAMGTRARLAEAHLELGELESAMELASLAREHFSEFGPADLNAYTSDILGRILSARGDHAGAWQHASRALLEAERLIRGFHDLALQQRFIQVHLVRFASAFGIALAPLASECDPETRKRAILRAWAVAERAKAFYLRQIVASGSRTLLSDASPEDAAALAALEEEMDRMERSAAGLQDPSGQCGDISGAYQKRKELLKRAIARGHASWATLLDFAPLDLELELGKLGDDVLVFAYYWHRQRAQDAHAVPYLFWWRAGEVHLAPLALNRELAAECSQLRQRLCGEVGVLVTLASPELADALLPPELWRATGGARLVLVSPHQETQMVPLHAFVGSRGQRLIDVAPVQYAPTLALLDRPRRSEGSIQTVGILACSQDGYGGRALPEFEQSLGELQGIWREAQVVARSIGPDQALADVGLALRCWSEFDLLHLCCHGRAPEGQPLDAALYLGKDRVRASELFATQLKARLVSLCACELGRQASSDDGAEFVTDEWAGMYLPLLSGGSGMLLLSLWDADVKTAVLFMRALHTSLAGGASPPMAFADACRAMRRRAPLWANWYLVGLPESAQRNISEEVRHVG